MANKELEILKRAYARERAARKQAEKILEEKSAELFELNNQVQKSNILLKEKVKETTTQLEGVFENIIDAYVVMDMNGNVLKMNDAAEDLFDYKADDDSLNVVGLIYREDIAYAMKAFESLNKDGYFTNYKARIFTGKKEVKWVHINASLIYDDQQQPIAAQGIVRDITKSQLSAKLIAEQQKKLSAIVDHSSLGIVLTQKGQIIQTNAAAQTLLQYDEEELSGLHVKDISGKDEFSESAEYMTKMNEHGLDHFVIKKRYLKKDGSEVWARTNVAAVRNQDGSILYQVALIEDITEQLKNENERRLLIENIEAQKQKYSSIIANMNLGLLEVDTEDRIIMSNQSFEKMSGYSEEEMVSKKAAELLLVKDFQPKLIDENSKRERGETNSYEVEALTKKGEKRNWLISGAPNYDINGNIIGSIGIHLDITALKSLELQKEVLLKSLEKSNNELQEYAHIVSHDLKSPLRSLYALVDWVMADNAETFNEETNTNMSLIQSTLEKMDQLISDILDYSSVTAESSMRAPVDLNVVVEDLKQILFIPEHISLIVKKPLPIIEVDRVRIQQVFQNLISNSAKFIDKKDGLIEIDFKETKKKYQFSVKDNGIGIAPEYHEKIFKIFQSLEKATSSSGIGLSIVKKIVNLYDGTIWLESTPEIGTTFYFTISKSD